MFNHGILSYAKNANRLTAIQTELTVESPIGDSIQNQTKWCASCGTQSYRSVGQVYLQVPYL